MKNLKYQWTNFIKWLNKPKKLSEKTGKKFVESIRVEDWEVLTEDGYKPIYSTNQTIEYDVYILYFENGYKLRCADNHILIDHQGDEVFSKDALGKYFRSDDLRFDFVQCIRVEKTNKREVMYDLTVNSKDHTYYTNGILSHNSITTLSWLLHYALFNSDKTIAILANKGATAREMLSRVTLMLENIPFFMQPGCKELNKGSIHFSNNSKIIAASTSSSSIRGFAINCVPDYTKTTIMLDDGQIYYNTISKNKEIINKFEQANSPRYTMKINSKKYYTVYKITNKINNKEYIGFHSTNDLDDGYMGSGKLIQKEYEKYGLEHFEKEYIEIFDSLKEAEDLEKELVNKEYVEGRDTYNMSIGGNICILYGEHNGFYSKEHNKETKEFISESNKGKTVSEEQKSLCSKLSRERWKDPEYRKATLENLKRYRANLTEEQKKEIYTKISLAQKGKKVSEETKRLLSERVKKKFENFTDEEWQEWYDKVHTPEAKLKKSIALKGKKKTKEHVDKINRNLEKIRKTAEKHRGMKRSEESKKKMSISAKKRPPPNKGLVYCYNQITLEKKMCKAEEVPERWNRGFLKK